jgi:hypothetical protein
MGAATLRGALLCGLYLMAHAKLSSWTPPKAEEFRKEVRLRSWGERLRPSRSRRDLTIHPPPRRPSTRS